MKNGSNPSDGMKTQADTPIDRDATARFDRLARKPEVPNGVLTKWQGLVDTMARRAHVPAGLIMKAEYQRIVVFVASATSGNPYKRGGAEPLNSGLYCETVMARRESLLVPNARQDPEWDHNPDIKLGMISYLGYPVLWPDGEVFGTVCILDEKENSYSASTRDLLTEIKATIEQDLKGLV